MFATCYLKDAGMAVPIVLSIISSCRVSFWLLQKSDGSGRMRVDNYILYQVTASIAAAMSGVISFFEQISMLSEKW